MSKSPLSLHPQSSTESLLSVENKDLTIEYNFYDFLLHCI